MAIQTARRSIRFGGALLFGLCLTAPGAEAAAPEPAPATAIAPATVALPKDPIRPTYLGYTPDFVDMINRGSGYGESLRGYAVPKESMDLSAEKSFYTLSRINESDRANALVEAGIQKEREGLNKEAIEIYQKILDEYPDALFRVAQGGVFVPISQYCQRRILNFPPDDLAFYRTKVDSRAKDAFELARQRNSLEALADIRDNLLATSYGAPSLMTLGYSALDQGRFLEALEYFNTVWDFFPDQRTQNPNLAMSMALCRKMLGQGEQSGERYGLVGQWKIDEGQGALVADASGFGCDGAVQGPPKWVPGKTGSALRFDWTNAVSVRPATFMDIGTGGQGFSFSFWVNWARVNDHKDHFFFVKSGTPEEMTGVSGCGKGQIRYTIATQSPTWETGTTKGSIPLGTWAHVALVKSPGNEVRIYLNGRLDLREQLKTPANRNNGAVMIGRHMHGAMDEVRLYNRALLAREVAEAAGTLGKAVLQAAPLNGEAPLTVEFSTPVADPKADCFWEFGDGETARGAQVRHLYGLGGNYTAICTVTDATGTISSARTQVTVKWRQKDEAFVKRMDQAIRAATHDQPTGVPPPPRISGENATAEDYAPWTPSGDPMGVQSGVWRDELAGARNDQIVYSQPVVTSRSVLYRHKNIVYCRSILNGGVLWANNLGGRVVWQNRRERQYPLDGLVAQDGLVFTVMHKVGPSVVALDEVTGQLKWAYGPMVAATREESLMRFEATPASGPGTIYAGYVLDNVEGDTHTDTEYGVIAFESGTGRIRWRRELSRLQPGLFSAGFAETRRIKIRSFSSPPLYHEGTIYTCTDAGVIAALDALSGRVKWLMRYPYWPSIHDATKVFGALPEWSGTVFSEGMNEPSFWFNQRPWIVDDRLYVLPVDSTMMHCLNRWTGKVEWSRVKGGGNYSHVLGPTREGYLVLATSGRGGIVHLLDQTSGKTIWTSPDPILAETHPVMTYDHNLGSAVPGGFNDRGFFLAARPFLTADDRLCTSYLIDCGFNLSPWCSSLAEISLRDRKVIDRRRYYVPAYQAFIGDTIVKAAERVRQLEELPHKDDRIKAELKAAQEIAKDTVPANAGGPFLPFSRMTFARFGVPFELRFGARSIEMLYDREGVKKALGARTDPAGLFARAELALGESRLQEASSLMQQARAGVSPEDVDFRAVVNQQLHLVFKRLAQGNVRAGQREEELANCIGMSQTVVSLADEMETLLALSEAYERKGDFRTAARIVQQFVNSYGQYEYALPSILIGERESLARISKQVLEGMANYTKDSLYGQELGRSAALTRRGLGLYFSALSPLKRDLRIRAGELGAQRLLALRKASPELGQELEKQAGEVLLQRTPADQLLRLWEFPGTAAAQKVLDDLLSSAASQLQKPDLPLDEEADLRKREWALADAARIGGLRIPDARKARLLAPAKEEKAAALTAPLQDKSLDLAEDRSPAWLALARHGQQDVRPGLAFLGARVKKKIDSKFLLYCLDLASGKIVWKAQEKRGDQWFDEIRLGDKGAEPGFAEAFVYQDIVVVHGMVDVLAFDLQTGRVKWRYVAPYGFEIRHAIMNGDLLVLTGDSDTVALCLGTRDPRGEIAWQQKEEGALYMAPYFVGDRLVELRKMPENLTVRYRSTGKLIGRLALPDLSLFDEHPLIDKGPRALPVAHDGALLAITDGWYYYLVDVEKLAVVWKRLIDQNDASRPPPMRMAMEGDYLAVVKQDYDVKAIYMLSSRTGEILWRTDPKVPGSTPPMDAMVMRGGNLYGIRLPPGQAFTFAGVDCQTGKDLFPPNEQKGYGGKPEVELTGEIYGRMLVARIRDRQDFELKAFDTQDGKLAHTIKVAGTGDFGEHGSASATVQDGSLVLLGRNDLKWAAKK